MLTLYNFFLIISKFNYMPIIIQKVQKFFIQKIKICLLSCSRTIFSFKKHEAYYNYNYNIKTGFKRKCS